ncbi:MAG TPA: PDZ domain-containing protein, partial [Planctomycetota bacterium]|nr:PDZ domain-containing protein [Planctomycetota bacterium]
MLRSVWLLTFVSPFLSAAPQEPPAPAAPASTPAAKPRTFRADQVEPLTWRHLGPVNMSGRVTDFEAAGHVWYVGTAASGVWKTTNRGTTWKALFQTEASCSIGDVAVAPANPDIVWVGTGEDNPRNSVSWGDGVYKSTDGGQTWKHMGLSDSFQIGHIAIHPTDPNVVFVAALGRLWGPNRQRGVFRTRDGGETWEHVLFLDENTGAIDVRIHPNDPNIVWATTWERRRNAFDDNHPEVNYGEKAGLWRSTDGGTTFTRITAGLPSCKWGRSGLAVYRKNPDTLFLIVDTERAGWATGTERTTGRDREGAFLGVQSEDAEEGGVRVTLVSEGGPAAQAGVQEGDVLLRIGDREIKQA